MNAKEVYRRAEDGAALMQERFTKIALPSERYSLMSLLSHTHFINYGGGYYSYLFAKTYAAQIWMMRFQDDPLSRASGELLRDRMLAFGASRASRDILEDLGQGPLDPQHFISSIINYD